MPIRHVCLSGAAVLIFVVAAFAQTTGQTPAQTPGQAASQTESQITLVGCLQREADYRRAQSSGRGGVVGTGAGLANEFILVNASTTTGTTGSAGAATAATGTTPGTASPTTSPTTPTTSPTTSTPAGTPAPSGTSADCTTETATGEAYELTGNRERELEKFVGRRVEITGMLKRAETASGTTGTAGTTGAPQPGAKPTGGFDPMGQDLKLHEVNVSSFREVGASRPPGPEPEPAAQAAAPTAPAATPAEPEPQSVGTSGTQQELPRTASPLPIAGLIGLLSLGGALGLRSLRRR